MIDLRLFRLPAFSASLAIYLLAYLVMFGVYIFIAQYLQLVLALSPLQAGFVDRALGACIHRRIDVDAGPLALAFTRVGGERRFDTGSRRVRCSAQLSTDSGWQQ